MNIIKNTNFTAYRNCRERVEKVKYIVIHYTGGEGTAADQVKYFNNGNRSASAHYFVDRSGEIREYCDPKKWYAWHCGGSLESSHHPYYGKCTNSNSVGVEICTHNNGKTWEFTKEAVAAAEELTKYLMKEFGISADYVIRHYDVTGKSCPRVPGWGAVGGNAEWEKFKKAIGAETVETPATEEKKWYRVRKTWEDADSQIGAYLILDNAIAEANNSGSKYAVYDWEGKEIYRYSEASGTKNKELHFYYPGYTRKESPYDSHGAGVVWHDQNKNCVVYDAYWKGTEASKKQIQYLKDNGLRNIDAVLSHAHGDHGGGFFTMLEDKTLTIENFYCCDPDSLKLAGDGTKNGKSAKEDKEYLQNLISKMKAKGAKIHYVKTGDTITCGDMAFEVCRNQPSKWGEYDTGEAWGYLNDGSINLYERSCHMLHCGDGGGKKAAEYFDGDVDVAESEHHGNGDGASKVSEVKKRGCGLAIECNYETNGPGSCGWTRYGAGRFKDAGITVWQLDADIEGTVKGGTLTVTQGSNKKTFDVPFGKVFYRVRKTWADASSQIGAYTQIDKAKECVDQHPGYTAFDETGKAVYPATESSGTQEQTQTSSGSSGKTQEQTQVTPNPNMDNEVFIQIIGELAQEDMAKSGVLASVTIAQAILESGWGKSELALNAKNLFGMKCSLSGNTWAGSTWDGKSAYNVTTGEYYSGTYTTVRRDFRRYKSWAESVADHSAYLTGAMNGSKLRYSGLKGQKDYRKAVQIIKDGDYATSPTYTTNLCNLIKKYNLTLYDGGSPTSAQPAPAPAAPAAAKAKTLAELMPVIGVGDKGRAVEIAQVILGGLATDGSFGPKTKSSTVAFQKKKKLEQDSIIGKNTWAALFVTIKGGADKLPELKRTSSGKAVMVLQIMLGGLEVDGSFGPKTEARLKAVTGQITTTYDVWNALISAL